MLNIREAAVLLTVGESTVRRLLKSGKLSSLKVGRQFRIEQKSIEDFIRLQTEKIKNESIQQQGEVS